MKFLRLPFSSFFRILTCRRSFLHFPKTIPSPEPIHETLKRRIERVPDSTVSITPLLWEWYERGIQTGVAELRSIITLLHRSNRFSHALQISEWMSEQKAYNLSSVDFETRLLLIAKVHGLEEAYKFLDTIPVKKRDFYVHNALLNCCKTQSSVSIAEATFQKMRDLGLAANKPDAYSTMLYLYNQAGNHDMVVKLLREMDNKNMEPEGLNLTKLLTSYSIASVKDIEGMEKFLSKWKERMEQAWATCFFPGLVYMESGSKEKGLALLRKTEQLLDGEDGRKTTYGCLMKAYCVGGEGEDVYRMWKLHKDEICYDSFGSSNLIKDIIEALTKKGHLDWAHEVLEEWKTKCTDTDLGLIDDLGMIDLGLMDFGVQKRYVKEEAEKVLDLLGKKESKLESLANKFKHLVEDEEDKEEERRRKVAEAMEGKLQNRWNPKNTLALSAYACVQYVEGRRDMESTVDILRLMNKQEQVLNLTDKARLSQKMVEAMRGSGYIGGED